MTKQDWKRVIIKSSLVVIIVAIAGILTTLTLQEKKAEPVKTPEPINVTENETFSYTADNLPETCNLDSRMACAVEFAVKCTLNPDFTGCRDSKLPRFIFMEDENLDRPTEMSFKIVKLKPLGDDLVEVHTDSSCNGNWFGLCQGRIIYVLVPDQENWRVKDLYAIVADSI